MNVKIAETRREKENAFRIRTKVFVDEQHVPPDLELDELDESSIHFVGILNGKPISASRLRFVDDYGKLERICILKEHRGQSYGKQMIHKMEKVIQEKGFFKAKLNAQTHAIEFYKKLGYHVVSNEFMDAGIPHVAMVKQM